MKRTSPHDSTCLLCWCAHGESFLADAAAAVKRVAVAPCKKTKAQGAARSCELGSENGARASE